jgi:integrase
MEEQRILSRRLGDGARAFVTGDVQDAASAKNLLAKGATLTEAAILHEEFRKTGLDPSHLRDAAAALKVLSGRTRLEDAARYFVETHYPAGEGRTVDQLVEDYIESRRLLKRRPDTMRDLRTRLGCASAQAVERRGGGILRVPPHGFAFDLAGVSVAQVTTQQLERWMERRAGVGPVTYRNVRVQLVGLFNFAKRRKYIRDNPAEPIETPRLARGEKHQPYVLPVEDAARMMDCATCDYPEIVPYIALCLFAGIRPTECTRLDWAQIDFTRREVFIRGDVSKTGDERFVEMSPNLTAWLLPHRRASGKIHFARAAMVQIRIRSKLRWTPDCLRHSFGSYHMAEHENAGKTALQMGHRVIGTLYEHYRRAVRVEDAHRFWAILPDGHRHHRHAAEAS